MSDQHLAALAASDLTLFPFFHRGASRLYACKIDGGGRVASSGYEDMAHRLASL